MSYPSLYLLLSALDYFCYMYCFASDHRSNSHAKITCHRLQQHQLKLTTLLRHKIKLNVIPRFSRIFL